MFAVVALAQPPASSIQIGSTNVAGGVVGDCLTVNSSRRLGQAACGGGGGGSVSLTGGTGISVSPNPITGTGVITNTAPGAPPAGSAGNQQIKHDASTFGASTITGNTAGATYGDAATMVQIGTLSLAANAFEVTTYGNTAAVAGGDGGGGTSFYLKNVDLSNPASPALVSTITATASIFGSGWSPFNFGKFCYFSSADPAGGQWLTYDCSNPSSPSHVSTISVPDVGQVYAAIVVGSKVYIATGAGSPSSHLYIYDITNRASPVLQGSVVIGGSGGGAEDGTAHMLIVQDNYAYISSADYTANGSALQIVNIGDPFNPTVTSTTTVPDGSNANPVSIALKGNYLFELFEPNGTCNTMTGAGCALRVYNVKDPASVSLVTAMLNGSTYQAFDAIAVGNRLYVAWSNIPGTTCPAQCEIEAFDISDPTTPTAISGYDLGAQRGQSIALFGKEIVILDDNSILHVLEIPGLSIPSLNVDQLHVGTLIADQDIRAEGTILANTGLKAGPVGTGSQGPVSGTSYLAPNCADSAGAAACSSYPTGAFVIDAGSTSTVVSTTAITATSRIFVQEDTSLGTELGVTCNTNIATIAFGRVSSRTAATSFTFTVSGTIAVNPACFSYWIIN